MCDWVEKRRRRARKEKEEGRDMYLLLEVVMIWGGRIGGGIISLAGKEEEGKTWDRG